MPTIPEYLQQLNTPEITPDPPLNPLKGETVDSALEKFFTANENDTKAVDLASMLLDSTTYKNVASQVAGAPSDIVGLMLMVQAADPVKGAMIKAKLNVDSVWDIPAAVPGNSEQIAKWIGGDPKHPSWLPAAFVSPGPTEVAAGAKAMFIGPLGAKNLGGKILDGLNEFRKGDWGVLDLKSYEKTGWFNWLDKKPRYHLPDMEAQIDEAAYFQRAEEIQLKPGQGDMITLDLEEIYPYEELYQAYPTLKGTKVNINIERGPDVDGQASYRIYDTLGEALGTKAQVSGKTGDINFFDIRNMDELKKILNHEVMHKIQKIEGFNAGGNSDSWMSLLEGAKSAEIQYTVLDDLVNGLVDPRNPDAAYEYAQEIAQQYTVSEPLARQLVFSAMTDSLGSNPERELQVLGALRERSIQDIALFMEEMGAKGNPEDFIADLPFNAMQRLAYGRYLRGSGEVEARVQEYMTNQPRIRNMNTLVEEGSGTKLDDVVESPAEATTQAASEITPEQIRSTLAELEKTDPELLAEILRKAPDTTQKSEVIPRYLDMEKGHNTVKVPVASGKMGDVKLDILKNPSEREFLKWQKQSDNWSFRTLRTENGDLFVWSAYSEALHNDVMEYLGRPTLKDIDFSDSATNQDVKDMIKGIWYGNDL